MATTNFEYVELRLPAWQIDLTDLVTGVRVDGVRPANQVGPSGEPVRVIRVVLADGSEFTVRRNDEIVIRRRRRCSVCPGERAEFIVTADPPDADVSSGDGSEIGLLLCERDSELALMHRLTLAPLP